MGAVALACARVVVSVDAEELRVRSWLLGVRITYVPMSEVERVEVEASKATRWGNWGLRHMLWGKMLVVRGDRALVLQLKSSRDVVIVVRGAEHLAREVEQLLTSRGV